MGDNSFLPVVASPLADIAPHGFFAPVSRNLVEDLIKACALDEAQVKTVSDLSSSFFGGVLHHFLSGNCNPDRPVSLKRARELFDGSGALSSLYAAYWSKAIALTDVRDHMPQARRNEWDQSIREMTTPKFDEETVIPTLRDLLLSRERFLAERVDGIFRNLSGEHVTNSPSGFNARMIIAHLVDSYGSTDSSRVGYINDLRCVIARFMGRDEPCWFASNRLVENARKHCRGEWIIVDGGALRLRAYKCGTAHLEVHPEMAWRLNAILAMLYPLVIPPESRTKPKKKPRDFAMHGRPLPFAVLNALAEVGPARNLIEGDWRNRSEEVPNTLEIGFRSEKAVRAEVEQILMSIGGVRSVYREKAVRFEFDYDPVRVIREIIDSGCLPDQKSHQYYPTMDELADRVIAEAQIGLDDFCLEPSAGQGHLAEKMPMDRTVCCEIAALHCRILRAKGHRTVERDFLEWAAEQAAVGKRFDRIVMNPPFSEGRSALHLDAARDLLAVGGQITAVLPSGFRNKQAPEGWVYESSEPISGAFPDASVSVVILKVRRVV